MKKNIKDVSPDSFPMTLSEFCSQLSATDKRVEAIGAFEFVERTAGRNKDTYSAYLARYNEFLNKPM